MADLTTHLSGLTLAHPIMPGAGPPVRDGKALLACAAGGAAALVTKTISVKAADVPSPNMADLKTYFLNTELWSELPPEQWLEVEYAITRQAGLPVIISLGYSAEDIAALAPLVAPFAEALELSTHYIGNDPRPMQDAIRAAKTTGLPVWVKMSPFREPQALAQAAQAAGADGIVAVNSYGPAFGVDIEHGGRPWMGGKGYGWISGPALKPIALRMIYDIARAVEIPIIGVGGISAGADVVYFLLAGATAVQVCTAAITNGPQIYGKIAAQLGKWLDEHGYTSVEEIRGLALRQPIPAMTTPPQLHVERCIGCNRCVTSCVYEALYLVEKKIHIHEERCAKCGLCISRCPVDALLPNN